MKTFYFTATGNSLYVAKRIGGELHSIPHMIKAGKYTFEDEAIGFAFPCYSLGVPRMVAEFILESKLKAEYFFAVMTYGNMAAGGLKQMEEIGAKANIRFNYVNEILMIDNYLPVFNIEKELKKEASKKIEENLGKIVSDIEGRQNNTISKNFAVGMLSNFIHRSYTKNHAAEDKKFIVQESCNSCRVCEKVCPKIILKVKEKPGFSHNCESCYACIHHCPQQAIILKKERSRARFINRNVELKEIIAANNSCGEI